MERLPQRGALLLTPTLGGLFSILCTPADFHMRRKSGLLIGFLAFHTHGIILFNSQSSLMDKITPSREAATVTTARGTSIGYVPVFVLGISTHMHLCA